MRLLTLMFIISLALVSACGDIGADQTAEAEVVPQATATPARDDKPIIIAHRGASGLYPEHTLEAYAAAIDMGADFIEPDLVMTKDGVLVARHERYLSETTNVADKPEFADRLLVKEIGGTYREDWFVEDFTLAELKTLRARQPRADRDQSLNDQFAIPTFTEILGLVAISNGPEMAVGIYPELKSPRVFASLGHDMEGALLKAMNDAGIAEAGVPVFIQCFDPDTLRRLDAKTDYPLVQLLPASTDERLSPQKIAAYADGVGPWKNIVMLSRGGPLNYMEQARGAGLFVHPYTYRADDIAESAESFEAELEQAFLLGVDGVFTDHPGIALAIRDGDAASVN